MLIVAFRPETSMSRSIEEITVADVFGIRRAKSRQSWGSHSGLDQLWRLPIPGGGVYTLTERIHV